MVYVPEVLVYHAHGLTLRTFLRQHFKYGCGAFRFHELRATRNHQRVKVEPQSFYLNLFLYPFKQKYRFKSSLISILLVISQVSNAIGFFWERFTQNKKAGKANGSTKYGGNSVSS